MKKNVFSRAIAVLASMTVLGAASMMSASAAGEGVKVSDVTVPYGSTEAKVELSLIGDFSTCQGGVLTVTYPAELTVVKSLSNTMASNPSDGAVSATYVAPAGLETTFSDITFGLPEDAEAGTVYEIGLTITSLDNGGSYVEAPVAEAGSITIEAEPTEAPTEEPTEAPTEAPTAAPAVTTAAPATTVAPKKTGSPKTGSAGVAVAVAGLVTAGATAVVLKKKH